MHYLSLKVYIDLARQGRELSVCRSEGALSAGIWAIIAQLRYSSLNVRRRRSGV